MPKYKLTIVEKGGPGSGHHGHAGRPGKRGGSTSGTGTSVSGNWSSNKDYNITGEFAAGDKKYTVKLQSSNKGEVWKGQITHNNEVIFDHDFPKGASLSFIKETMIEHVERRYRRELPTPKVDHSGEYSGIGKSLSELSVGDTVVAWAHNSIMRDIGFPKGREMIVKVSKVNTRTNTVQAGGHSYFTKDTFKYGVSWKAGDRADLKTVGEQMLNQGNIKPMEVGKDYSDYHHIGFE